MRHGVGAVGGVQEEHARLAVMVGLVHDLVEQLAGAQGPVHLDGYAGGLGLLEGAVEAGITRVVHVREAQVPGSVLLHGAHEGVGDADRDVEIGDGVLVGLAGDELFDVGVVDAQHGHVGAAARVVGQHAVRQVGVVLIDLQVEGQRLPGLLHGLHLHEPQPLGRTDVGGELRVSLAELVES
jgi:hypothetical protein